MALMDTEAAEGPMYRLTAAFRSAPPHAMQYAAGSLIEHDGKPTSSMVPVNDAARARVAQWRATGR